MAPLFEEPFHELVEPRPKRPLFLAQELGNALTVRLVRYFEPLVAESCAPPRPVTVGLGFSTRIRL